MTQRNPLNERYSEENRTGKTRKSSASAKPAAQRAATVRDPAPKTKQQKKAERRERERQQAEKAEKLQVAARFESTEGYKRLRRIWWIVLAGAIVMTALSFYLTRNDALAQYSTFALVVAYALIIAAFWIDLGKIRRERKIYNASLAANNSKAARKEQKRLRAEMREQEKEAAEKFEAAKAEEAAKKASGGIFSRLRKPKAADAAAEADATESADKRPSSPKE